MLKFNTDINNCSGCNACASVCPRSCISMKPDELGFLYPYVSSECIDCGLCEKACPWVKDDISVSGFTQKVYAMCTNDRDIWHESTSGGAFTEICKKWADVETFIYGASWDGLKVRHIGIKGIGGISKLRKSKYVASYIGNTYKEIKEKLKNGHKVIFCGTPCQVDGLNHFLGNKPNNLLTIDLVCHGQGSPVIFQDFINYMESVLGEEIIRYEFRTKGYLRPMSYASLITTNVGKHYFSLDPYNQLFLSQNSIRPVCVSNCRYRSVKRCSDITLADCKGFESIFKEKASSPQNFSTIVCNTEVGLDIVSKFDNNVLLMEYNIEDVIKYNPYFSTNVVKENKRTEFVADYEANGQAAIKKWTKAPREIKPSPINSVYKNSPAALWPLISKFYYYFLQRLKYVKFIK